MTPPQFIPASEFKPRFDTSTTAGKIAVMQEAERVGYVYVKQTSGINWRLFEVVDWGWGRVHDSNCDYNFPAEPRRMLIPWTKDNCPLGAWIRDKVYHQERSLSMIFVATREQFRCVNWYTYDYAARKLEHSLDGGKTWAACGTWKEEA